MKSLKSNIETNRFESDLESTRLEGRDVHGHWHDREGPIVPTIPLNGYLPIGVICHIDDLGRCKTKVKYVVTMDGFIREQNIHVYVLFLWRIIAFLSCENETCVVEQGLPYTPCPLWLWGLNSLQSLQYLYRRWHEELNSTIKVTTLTNKWMIQIITVHVTCGQIITEHSIQMPCQ